MVEPQVAPVRPRVVPPDGGDPLPLQDFVADLLSAGRSGVVLLIGPRGTGKSTALSHLAAWLAEQEISPSACGVVDDVGPDLETQETSAPLTIAACHRPSALSRAMVLRLARWDRDECIEYLLATHPDKCPSVMTRLEDRHVLDGSPLLFPETLNALAADETLPDCRSALRRLVKQALQTPAQHAAAIRLCRRLFLTPASSALDDVQALINKGLRRGTLALLWQPAVQRLLVAEGLIEELRAGQHNFLGLPAYASLHEDLAPFIAAEPKLFARLEKLLSTRKEGLYQSQAASLLHAAHPGWRPKSLIDGVNLEKASLSGVRWPGIPLGKAELFNADFSGADLRQAVFDSARMVAVNLSGANLQRASLRDVEAMESNFARADLRGARLEHAWLSTCHFVQADLSACNLSQAILLGSDFEGSKLADAQLCKAQLAGADFTNCDLSGANLREAVLRQVDLRSCRLDGACCEQAKMSGANLEGAEWFLAQLAGADLRCAAFTGLRMPQADLKGADLAEARLAEIDWPFADLRDADLRGATFHMGSTRSGLHFTPDAGDGSKTGFYTDDALDQTFNSPEEVRKANLRGADLRGAKLANVDFYLVDLRDAQLEDDQRDHAARCGAILESRRC